MRTKTLLLSAALLAVGLTASVAQSVFSVNAVGYVNVTVVSGYSLLGNPLNGTNNNINTIIPSAPEGSSILRWDSSTQNFRTEGDNFVGGEWVDGSFLPSSTVLNPGEAFFFNNPLAPAVITFVGEVPQGSLTNRVPANYGFLSSIVPQEASLTALGFPTQDGMSYLEWIPGIQQYGNGASVVGGVWLDEAFQEVNPTPGVAEGFVINNPSGVPIDWTRTFNVNN